MNKNVALSPGPILERPLLRRAGMPRVGIGYAMVDSCSSAEACAAIVSHIRKGGSPAFVITPNAQHIVLLAKDRSLRRIYERADLVVPDGISLVLASRLYGRSLRERVTGVDIFQTLCGIAADENLKVFLLGGRPSSAELTAQVLKQKFPRLEVDTYCPPIGFEQTEEGIRQVNDVISEAAPDILFVALGAPKQETWIYEQGLRLSVPVSIGVGGTFEIVSGVVPRAPKWIQNVGCEWLYRLCREPRRMWRRYLIGNIEFVVIILSQRIRRTFLEAFVKLIDRESFAAEFTELVLLPEQRLARILSAAAAHKLAESRDSVAV